MASSSRRLALVLAVLLPAALALVWIRLAATSFTPPPTDAALAARVDAASPAIVVLGNSIARMAVDADALEEALGMSAVSITRDGSPPAAWAQLLEDQVLARGHRPRAVIVPLTVSWAADGRDEGLAGPWWWRRIQTRLAALGARWLPGIPRRAASSVTGDVDGPLARTLDQADADPGRHARAIPIVEPGEGTDDPFSPLTPLIRVTAAHGLALRVVAVPTRGDGLHGVADPVTEARVRRPVDDAAHARWWDLAATPLPPGGFEDADHLAGPGRDRLTHEIVRRWREDAPSSPPPRPAALPEVLHGTLARNLDLHDATVLELVVEGASPPHVAVDTSAATVRGRFRWWRLTVPVPGDAGVLHVQAPDPVRLHAALLRTPHGPVRLAGALADARHPPAVELLEEAAVEVSPHPVPLAPDGPLRPTGAPGVALWPSATAAALGDLVRTGRLPAAPCTPLTVRQDGEPLGGHDVARSRLESGEAPGFLAVEEGVLLRTSDGSDPTDHTFTVARIADLPAPHCRPEVWVHPRRHATFRLDDPAVLTAGADTLLLVGGVHAGTATPFVEVRQGATVHGDRLPVGRPTTVPVLSPDGGPITVTVAMPDGEASLLIERLVLLAAQAG